jgi:hypothetical protein
MEEEDVRVDYRKAFPKGFEAMLDLEQAVRSSELDSPPLELVKLRASQVPSTSALGALSGVICWPMNDQRGPPGVMDDGTGNAAKEHGTQPRQSARPDHDCGRIMSCCGFDDRLPDRPICLDRQRFGIQARPVRDAGTLICKPVAMVGCRPVELDGIDHPGWLTGPGDAVEASKALPDGDDERAATRKQGGRSLDRVLRVVRAVVADQQRAARAVRHPSPRS